MKPSSTVLVPTQPSISTAGLAAGVAGLGAASVGAATASSYPSGVPYGQEGIALTPIPGGSPSTPPPFGPQGTPVGNGEGEVATVVRPHIPQLSDELLLSPGDTVVIQKVHDDGKDF